MRFSSFLLKMIKLCFFVFEHSFEGRRSDRNSEGVHLIVIENQSDISDFVVVIHFMYPY